MLKGLQAPRGLSYQGLNCSIPAGVHISSSKTSQDTVSAIPVDTVPGRPLVFHPQLVSAMPRAGKMDATIEETTPSTSHTAAHESPYLAHRRQASVDDVLEVVEALSKLRGRGKGTIPRVR
jgi:hypothetical protein